MNDPVEDGARAAAQHLAAQYGSQLSAEVETVLRKRYAPASHDQYLDPVGLGGLIVAIATLAWTVYSGLKTKTAAPSSDAIIREVQAQLSQTRNLNIDSHAEIITITIRETLKCATDNQQHKNS
jgi:hypothetical protein